MRPVACPLGFTELDLPAGAEVPAAWRTPAAREGTPSSPTPAQDTPMMEADGVERYRCGRHQRSGREPPAAPAPSSMPTRQGKSTLAFERGAPPCLSVEVTPEAYALYHTPALHEAERREDEHDVGVGNGQLASACYALLGLSFVAISPELSPTGLAVAALSAAALGAYAHHQLGRGPNVRRSRRHLAAGRFAAAEQALAWHPARGEGLLQLAEVRRRQRQWRDAAVALLRLQPDTPELMRAFGRQLEAVAARYPGALEAFTAASDAHDVAHLDDLGAESDDEVAEAGAGAAGASERRVHFADARATR